MEQPINAAYERCTIKYPLGSSKDVLNYYDTWATQYDDDLKTMGSKAPEIVAERAAQITSEDQKKCFKILDLSAGTGLGGVALRHVGFLGDIYALDGSKEMLKYAKNKHVYSEVTESIVTTSTPLPYNDNSFDLIIGIGCFGKNMIQPDCFQDIMRVLKSGCYFVTSLRMHSLVQDYSDLFEKELLLRESDGSLKVIYYTATIPTIPVGKRHFGKES
uniref:Methyltransferase type 11 domain-containing protein n=1 Tax=Ciona savignyi TaxID=51511 RepID=H2YPM5_CIOSA